MQNTRRGILTRTSMTLPPTSASIEAFIETIPYYIIGKGENGASQLSTLMSIATTVIQRCQFEWGDDFHLNSNTRERISKFRSSLCLHRD